jgi:hypothetical protein
VRRFPADVAHDSFGVSGVRLLQMIRKIAENLTEICNVADADLRRASWNTFHFGCEWPASANGSFGLVFLIVAFVNGTINVEQLFRL